MPDKAPTSEEAKPVDQSRQKAPAAGSDVVGCIDRRAQIVSLRAGSSNVDCKGRDLSMSERLSLVKNYKKQLVCLRSWRDIAVTLTKCTTGEQRSRMFEDKELIEDEFNHTCNELLQLVELYLLPNASKVESSVFFSTLKADCYRYLAEMASDNVNRQRHAVDAELAYRQSYDLARKLKLGHPARISVVLNMGVYYQQILGDAHEAWVLAEQELESAKQDKIAQGENPEKATFWQKHPVLGQLRASVEDWKQEADEMDYISPGDTPPKSAILQRDLLLAPQAQQRHASSSSMQMGLLSEQKLFDSSDSVFSLEGEGSRELGLEIEV